MNNKQMAQIYSMASIIVSCVVFTYAGTAETLPERLGCLFFLSAAGYYLVRSIVLTYKKGD